MEQLDIDFFDSLTFVLKNKKLVDEIRKCAIFKSFLDETEIIRVGDTINFVPIVIDGTIKIFREDEFGKEILLYYIKPFESCVVSLSTKTEKTISTIKALALSNTSLILIPIQHSLNFYNKYPEWNNFILNLHQKRFSSLLGIIDQVTFNNIEDRIIDFFKRESEATKTKELFLTHQDIATELCTAREVISRTLKKIEKENKIILGRKKITLLF
ncbi:MAG: Crp/Fnr family transcriptional regulator [Candidatus Sericytochromatia bacterium]